MTSVVYPFDTPAGSDVDAEGVRSPAKAPMVRARMVGGPEVLSDARFSREAAARHTRIRALVAKAFSPRTVERLEPRVRELVGGLLDELEAHGAPADLVRLLAEPLPIMVICELLGVPDADRAKIRQWAGVLIAETAHTAEEIGAAIHQVNAYLAELIAARRADPDTALISALIAVNDEGQHLSASELISNVQLLLVAGHETTVSQIGNSMVTLFQHPEQLTLLRKQPELLPAAVDELLRHSKLTTSTLPRVVTQDAQVGDTLIRAGEAVIPLIAVADRDPDAFPDPHRFDVTRTGPAPHVALGHGPHYCLGAQLARLELQRSLRALPVTW